MLVDDAIIVAENIFQHFENGESPFEATVKGASEVFWPVTATILTTISAFSPLLLVSGIFGKFIADLPKVVILALILSLFEALLILPTHAYDVLRWQQKFRLTRKKKTSQMKATKDKPLIKAYGKLLRVILKWRYAFVVAVVGLLLATFWFAKNHMKFILFPSEGIQTFFVRLEQPLGTSLETTAKRFAPLEKLILSEIPKSELRDVVTMVGMQQNDPTDPFKKRGSHIGQLSVYLTAEVDRERIADEIIESIRPQISQMAGKLGFDNLVIEKLRRGPPVGKPVAIRIAGEDFVVLEEIAQQVIDKLHSIKGVKDVDTDLSPGKTELQAMIDYEGASQSLLSVRNIAIHLRALLEGEVASHVSLDGDRVAIRVRYPEEHRQSPFDLIDSTLMNNAGLMTSLSGIISFQKKKGINSINHRDGVRTVTVSSAIDEEVVSSQIVNQLLIPTISELKKKYPEYTLSAGGEYEETNESYESLKFSFIIASAIIFLILSSQFKSLTQPFVVMIAIPFGLIGVIYAFYLHGLPLSFLGMVGVIGLSGVVVNDSIVLVDFINKAKAQGMAPIEAAVHSGMRRFRAVWLTTITTILGVIPMVYGIGGTDKFLQPAALALGYGLIFGTVLILLFVPSIYMIHEDILGRIKKVYSPKS